MTFPKYLLQYSLSSCPFVAHVTRCTSACWLIRQRGVRYFQSGGACAPFSMLLLFLFFLGGDVISVPTGQTDDREPCYSLSAAGDRRRNMQAFVPRVTEGQGNPRVQKPLCESLILGVVCMIFSSIKQGQLVCRGLF